jgi:hypothetical protein
MNLKVIYKQAMNPTGTAIVRAMTKTCQKKSSVGVTLIVLVKEQV